MAPLAFCLRLPVNQKGSPCHPGEDSTILAFRALRQPLVRTIGMQTKGLFLAIKAANGAEPVLRVSDDRSPLESEGTSPTIGLALPACRCLQAVQLSAMQSRWHQIPQPGRVGDGCSAHRCRQDPTINRMALEGPPALALRLLESITFP